MSVAITPSNIEAVTAIYDAALDESKWPALLDRIASEAGIQGITLFVDDRERTGLSFVAANSFLAGYIDEYVAKVLPLEGHEYLRLYDYPACRIHLDTEMRNSFGHPDNMPAMKDLRERLGVKGRCATTLHDKGVWQDAFTGQFTFERAEFADTHRERINLFLPHLAKVVELARPFTVLRHRYQAVLAALDYLHLGIFILGPRHTVIVMNQEAQRILEQRDGLRRDQRQRLVAEGHGQNASLANAIARGVSTASAQDRCAESLLVLQRRSGRDPYLVEVCPITDRGTEFEGIFRGAFVLVIDPANTGVVSTAGMERLYGLTPSESEICRLLAQGAHGKEIAQMRNVTPETVRTQIKTLLSKTRTRSRSQLVRLALMVNLPIGSLGTSGTLEAGAPPEA